MGYFALPPAEDDIPRRMRDLERTQMEQAAARSMEATSIGEGGLTVTDGGSIRIEDGGDLLVDGDAVFNGSLTVPSGSLNTAGSISAGANVTAGGTVQGASLVSTGAATIAGTLSAGAVSAGSVSASGQVFSAAPLRSPGSHDYIVTTDYVAGWINSDGTVGTSPSSRAVKKNLIPMSEPSPSGTDAVEALLSLVPYWGHYAWDDDGSPLKAFVIAEDVQAAGFGPDIAPVNSEGVAYTVNYSQLVVPLIAAVQRLTARVAELEANPTIQEETP